jgi:hypothetical protein
MKIKTEIKCDLHIYSENDTELCRIKLILIYDSLRKSYELLRQVSFKFTKVGKAHHSIGFADMFDYTKYPFSLYMTIGEYGCDLNLSNIYIDKKTKLIISNFNINMSHILRRNKCQK